MCSVIFCFIQTKFVPGAVVKHKANFQKQIQNNRTLLLPAIERWGSSTQTGQIRLKVKKTQILKPNQILKEMDWLEGN